MQSVCLQKDIHFTQLLNTRISDGTNNIKKEYFEHLGTFQSVVFNRLAVKNPENKGYLFGKHMIRSAACVLRYKKLQAAHRILND